jgi:hypothetical protein
LVRNPKVSNNNIEKKKNRFQKTSIIICLVLLLFAIEKVHF